MGKVVLRVIIILALLGVLAAAALFAGYKLLRDENHTFTIDKRIPVTPIRYQGATRLCWDFTGMALLEAELLRKGRGEHDFSEMYIAHQGYMDRALAAARPGSETTFDCGGCCGDFLDCIAHYGVVPESAMPCPDRPNHRSYKAAVQEMAVRMQHDTSSADSETQLRGFFDDSIGVPSSSVETPQGSVTPHAYLQSLDLHPEDYIQLTSFTHHPFYQPFAVECPDNWRHDLSYNLPIDELMAVIDSAVSQGYTCCWEGDIGELGFRFYNAKGFVKRLGPWQHEVSQRQRQRAWDHHRTTDDHVMLICGKGHDEHGREYYLVKNCWGKYGPYRGFIFMSKAYIRYKAVTIMLHRDAIPREISDKLKTE